MENEKEESKTTAEETATQENSTEETKTGDNSSTEESSTEEKVILTKEDHEKLLKYKTDFNGIIEKQRIEKLAKKETLAKVETEEKPEEKEVEKVDKETLKAELKEELRQELLIEVNSEKKKEQETNLGEAYREFLKQNPWADSDEVIAKLGEAFNVGGAISKDEILSKLDRTARDIFPSEYVTAQESRIRAKVLAEQANIDAGDAGGSGSSAKGDTTADQPTAEDKRMADRYFKGDVKAYLKYKKSN
jgi:hypothetical protein